MDKAKLRMIAGGAAAVLAFVGTGALSIGAALALEMLVAPVWAWLIVGAILFAGAVGAAIVLAQPDKSTEEEVAEIETMTADALADLPFDTVKAVIAKRPLASLAIAVTTGYTLSRDPQMAARNLKRAITGLI